MAEQFSWVTLHCCFPPWCLLPVKSLALPARVSSDNSFLSVRQEPAFGALEGAPLSTTTADHKGTPPPPLLLGLTSRLLGGTQDQLVCWRIWPSCCNWDPFFPNLASVPWLVKEQEIFVDPFYLTPLFNLSNPSFSHPLVLDAGIWSKGLSLSWGLETDHLLLEENLNFGSGWVPVLPSLEAQEKVL